MRIVKAMVSLYRIVPYEEGQEPHADAVQVVEAVEAVVVRLFTDRDVDGLGLTYTIGRGGAAIKCILEKELVPLVIGEDPLNSERIWQKLWWACHWVGRTGITTMGIAAVDNAIWDLKGKCFGEPLYRLLGGCRDKVPAYVTDSGWINLPLEEVKSSSRKFVEAGFKGVKIKVGRDKAEEDLERVSEVRKVVGSGVEVRIDANHKFTIDEAVRRANLLKDLDISWFEEPLESSHPQAHATLRSKSPIPIALGESLYSKYEFRDYIEQKAVDIVQPDAGRIGITEWLKVAHLAECWGLPVAPHAYSEIHAHLVAAIPNGLIVEYFAGLGSLLVNPFKVERGEITIPQTPGNGLEFSQERIGKFLVEETSLGM